MLPNGNGCGLIMLYTVPYQYWNCWIFWRTGKRYRVNLLQVLKSILVHQNHKSEYQEEYVGVTCTTDIFMRNIMGLYNKVVLFFGGHLRWFNLSFVIVSDI